MTLEVVLTSGAVLATSGRPSDILATKVSSGGIFVVFVAECCIIESVQRFVE